MISNTLTESPWENTVVAGGDDLTETFNQLKTQQGGDMIAYGGGTLVSDLIAKGLLDELHLFVNPTAIGAGMPVFANLGAHQQLRLVTAQPFGCGITALHLEPKHSRTPPPTASANRPPKTDSHPRGRRTVGLIHRLFGG